MKKSIKKLLSISLAVFMAFAISGCKNNSDISSGNSETESTVSASEISVSETETAPTTTETETTTQKTTTAATTVTTVTTVTEKQSHEERIVPGAEFGFDIDGIEVFCEGYPMPDIREEFDEKLSEWREANDIVSPYLNYAYIDGYTVISAHSGEFAGNTQTAYVIVDCGDKIIEIDAGDITNIDPIYFVGSGVLYCYDNSVTAGFERFVLTEFSLTSGEKINEYQEIYSLGASEMYYDLYVNTYSDIDGLDELKSYISGISPLWYWLEGKRWDELTTDTAY